MASEAGTARTERRNSGDESEGTHANITLCAQTVRIRRAHLIHTLSCGVMGLSALPINALITKNEAVGRKSRSKCTDRLM